MSSVRLAIFASGTGSNAKKIIEYFEDRQDVEVAIVVSNKKHAPVLAMAQEKGLMTKVISKSYFYDTESILEDFDRLKIDWIILAGFLWLVPSYLIQQYSDKIINIHPALLPRFGGKGMYGMHVHRAVKASDAQETGITIHFVNEVYDDGRIIFQARCPVAPEDTPESIAAKVRSLEHRHFAQVIDRLVGG